MKHMYMDSVASFTESINSSVHSGSVSGTPREGYSLNESSLPQKKNSMVQSTDIQEVNNTNNSSSINDNTSWLRDQVDNNELGASDVPNIPAGEPLDLNDSVESTPTHRDGNSDYTDIPNLPDAEPLDINGSTMHKNGNSDYNSDDIKRTSDEIPRNGDSFGLLKSILTDDNELVVDQCNDHHQSGEVHEYEQKEFGDIECHDQASNALQPNEAQHSVYAQITEQIGDMSDPGSRGRQKHRRRHIVNMYDKYQTNLRFERWRQGNNEQQRPRTLRCRSSSGDHQPVSNDEKLERRMSELGELVARYYHIEPSEIVNDRLVWAALSPRERQDNYDRVQREESIASYKPPSKSTWHFRGNQLVYGKRLNWNDEKKSITGTVSSTSSRTSFANNGAPDKYGIAEKEEKSFEQWLKVKEKQIRLQNRIQRQKARKMQENNWKQQREMEERQHCAMMAYQDWLVDKAGRRHRGKSGETAALLMTRPVPDGGADDQDVQTAGAPVGTMDNGDDQASQGHTALNQQSLNADTAQERAAFNEFSRGQTSDVQMPSKHHSENQQPEANGDLTNSAQGDHRSSVIHERPAPQKRLSATFEPCDADRRRPRRQRNRSNGANANNNDGQSLYDHIVSSVQQLALSNAGREDVTALPRKSQHVLRRGTPGLSRRPPHSDDSPYAPARSGGKTIVRTANKSRRMIKSTVVPSAYSTAASSSLPHLADHDNEQFHRRSEQSSKLRFEHTTPSSPHHMTKKPPVAVE